MNDNFKNIVNKVSELVDAIISLMVHSQKSNARRMLLLLNEIIDFYLSKEDENIHFPIVQIPNCPDWAEDVLVEYLVLKLALSYNDKTINKLKALQKTSIMLKPNDGRSNKRFNDRLMYFRQYVSQICRTNIPLYSYAGKNLLFTPIQVLNASRGNKNEYLSDLSGGYNNLDNDSNLTICTEIGQKEIDDITYDNEPLGESISNLFVIYRNSDQCNSLTKSGIERAGLENVKNCFVFEFSQKPQRLYKTRARMIRLGHSKFECLASEKEALHNDDFITFTEEESLYLFGKPLIKQHVFIEDDQFYYNGMIGEFVGTCDYPILERNHLSLCLNKTLCDNYLRKAQSAIVGMNVELAFSLGYQQEIADNRIIPEILKFIGDDTRVAFILPHDATKQEKEGLKVVFGIGRKLKFYCVSELKPKDGKAAIKEKCIVNLTYRGHFTNSIYHKYPNSFDPYILNEGQRILDIAHGFSFNSIHEWDLYEYNKLLYQYTDSLFRKHHAFTLAEPNHPVSAKEIYDVEPDETQTRSNSTQTNSITFSDGEKISVLDTELIIYEKDSAIAIEKFSELKEHLEIFKGVKLQKLSALDGLIEEFMEKESQKANRKAQVLRDYYLRIGRLTKDEEQSDNTIWNILLRKKVEAKGEQEVYDELMRPLNDRERISLYAFRTWYSPESRMLLPLARKTQKRLIEYLDLSLKYLDAMRAIKRATTANSRANNQMIDQFMMDYLFSEITDEMFEKFEESPINESLQIHNIKDLETLVELIVEKIDLKTIAMCY